MLNSALKDRVRRIGTILDELYPDPQPALVFNSPFTLLIAVVLSAQCTDLKVNKVTPQLFALAPTPQDMYKLGEERIAEIIKPLGLFRTKAKNIQALSKQLTEHFAGQVPANFKDLEALPGVGHKTASVVMAQAFGIPAFPVDTHILRLSRRWHLGDTRNVKTVENSLKELFPPEEWNRRHLQIIYFGRQYCQAMAHVTDRCPICSWIEKEISQGNPD